MFTFVLYVCWCRIMLVFQFLFWKYLREVFVCVFVPAFCVCVFVLNYAKVISFFFFRKAFEGSRRPYCGPLMVPLSAVLTRLLLLLTLTVHEKNNLPPSVSWWHHFIWRYLEQQSYWYKVLPQTQRWVYCKNQWPIALFSWRYWCLIFSSGIQTTIRPWRVGLFDFGSGLTKKFGFRVRVRVLCILWS